MQQNNPRLTKISPSKSDQVRLFLALWPDVPSRKRLAQLARESAEHVGGRVMRAETLHITLLFIGALQRRRIPALESAVGTCRFKAFDLSLARLACWRHNRIAYVAPADTPAELASLVAQLRHSVTQAGIAFDSKPFVPHLTLLRNVERNFDAHSIPAMGWRVSRFALVASVPDARGVTYQTLREWPCVDEPC